MPKTMSLSCALNNHIIPNACYARIEWVSESRCVRARGLPGFTKTLMYRYRYKLIFAPNLFQKCFAWWKSAIWPPDRSVTTSNIMSFCMHKIDFDFIFSDIWFLLIGCRHRASVPHILELVHWKMCIFGWKKTTLGPLVNPSWEFVTKHTSLH